MALQINCFLQHKSPGHFSTFDFCLNWRDSYDILKDFIFPQKLQLDDLKQKQANL